VVEKHQYYKDLKELYILVTPGIVLTRTDDFISIREARSSTTTMRGQIVQQKVK
jgi:hypothetical protein